MPNEPQIEILSYKRRKRLFQLLVLIFLIALPTMIFYTTGYRLNFDNEDSTFVTTGGMYITTDTLDVEVYVDEDKIEKPRLFRSAYYIQSIESGIHRVVVQRPGLNTWVKELPVDPRIVVEASAFNMPVEPVIRPVTKFTTTDNQPVFLMASTAVEVFSKATSTIPYLASTTIASSSLAINEEYIFVDSLFGTSSTDTRSAFGRFLDEVDRFRFATTTEIKSTTTEEIVIQRGDVRLVDRKSDVYAVWQNGIDNIPYYYCVGEKNFASTSERFGRHVAESIFGENVASTSVVFESDRVCRLEIKLNRLAQKVFFYDFFPNSSDLVVLLLEDGLYVTEIDDRAWQNTQLLYPGDDFEVIVENDIIYIKEDENYFEIVTEIET
jgi:hypothetical protein